MHIEFLLNNNTQMLNQSPTPTRGTTQTGSTSKRSRDDFEMESETWKTISEERSETIGKLNERIKFLEATKIPLKLQAKNSQYIEAFQKNEKLKNKIEKIKNKHLEISNNYEICKKINKELLNENSNKEEKYQNMINQFNKFRDESMQLNQTLSTQYHNIVIDHQNLNEKFKNFHNESTQLNQRLSKENQVLQNKFSDELSTKNGMMDFVNTQINYLNENKVESANYINYMELEFNKLKSQYNLQYDQNLDQESRLNEQNNQIIKLRDEVLKKTGECAELKLKQSNNQKRIVNNKNTKQISKFKNEIDELKYELKQKIINIKEFETINGNLEKHNRDLLERNNTLEAYEYEKNIKITNYVKQLDKFKCEIKELKKFDSDKKLIISQFAAEIENLQKINESLKIANSEKDKILNNHEKEFENKFEQFSNEKNNLIFELKIKDAEVEKLQNLNKNLNSNLNLTTKHLRNKDDRMSQLIQVNSRATNQIKNLEEQVKILQKQVEEQKENNSRFNGKNVIKLSLSNHSGKL